MGVDIAKDSFTACIGCTDLTQQLHFLGKVTTCSNDLAGFSALQAWAVQRQEQAALPLSYVLEATGVYYEELAIICTPSSRR